MRNGLIGFILGAGLVVGVAGWIVPSCPTEDSCRPDYVKVWGIGIWTGKEQVP